MKEETSKPYRDQQDVGGGHQHLVVNVSPVAFTQKPWRKVLSFWFLIDNWIMLSGSNNNSGKSSAGPAKGET